MKTAVSHPPVLNAPAGLQVRPVHPQDAAQITALLNRVFARWGQVADWEWKYQGPPGQNSSLSAVACGPAGLVGHYGLLPVRAWLDGTTFLAAQCVDGGVESSERGKGVFSALGNLVLEQAGQNRVDLVYAFPGLRSINTSLQRHSFIAAAFVPEQICLLQPGKGLLACLERLPGDLLSLARSYAGQDHIQAAGLQRLIRLRKSLIFLLSWLASPRLPGLSSARHSSLQLELREEVSFGAEYDRFWGQVSGSLGFSLVKDAAYLNWRYFARPGVAYRVCSARQEGELLGFSVTRTVGRDCQVAEWLSLPGRPSVDLALLADARQAALRAGCLTMTAWAWPGSSRQKILEKFGFVSAAPWQRLTQRWGRSKGWFYQVIINLEHLPPARRAELQAAFTRGALSLGDSDLV